MSAGKPRPEQQVFDLDAARAARDEAVARADAHARASWQRDVDAVLLHLAERHAEFTADDVAMVCEAWGIEPTHDGRALGPRFNGAKAAGWVRPSDRFVPSSRTSRHAGPVRVWLSLIYRA